MPYTLPSEKERDRQASEWGVPGDDPGVVYDLIQNMRVWKDLRRSYHAAGWTGLLIHLLETGRYRSWLRQNGTAAIREIAYYMDQGSVIKECPTDKKHPQWYKWPRHRYVGASSARRAKACPIHAKQGQNIRAYRRKKTR